ncbi:hypothetical protein LJB42_002813 [Komagataella kurtzmanii]|nr:hypothetical protein LJB42_002813 [Komagataella kurtzmanii]
MEEIYQKPLPLSAPEENYQWCPTIYLISGISTNRLQLSVFRVNAQKVWSVSLKSEIICQCWRQDGKIIAVSLKDGSIRLYDGNMGTLMYVIESANNTGESTASFLSWPNVKQIKSQSSEESEPTLQEKLEKFFDFNLAKGLPKLTPLNNTDTVFMNKSLQDEDKYLTQDNTLNYLLTNYNNVISLSLLGFFQISSLVKFDSNDVILHHFESDDLSTLYFLYNRDGSTLLKQISLNFLKQRDIVNLGLSYSKINSLIEYVNQVLKQLHHETKPYLDFNHKLLDLLKEEIISSKGDETGISLLYGLLLTGIMHPCLKTWITDYLGDKNIRRWIKLAVNCYEGNKKSLFSHLLPCLERIIVMLDELKGSTTPLTKQQLQKLLSGCTDLLQKTYLFIWKINHEQRLFKYFIEWLDYVLLEYTTDDTPDLEIKTKEVTEFLTNHLTSSVMHAFLDDLSSLQNTIRIDMNTITASFVEELKVKTDSKDFPLSITLPSSTLYSTNDSQTHNNLKTIVLTNTPDALELISINLITADVQHRHFSFPMSVIAYMHYSENSTFILASDGQATEFLKLTSIESSPIQLSRFSGDEFIPTSFKMTHKNEAGFLIDSNRKKYLYFKLK